jgi:signal transduction histidine kinase
MALERASASGRAIFVNGLTSLVFTAVGNICAWWLYRPYAPPLILSTWAVAVILLLMFQAGVILVALTRIDRVGEDDPVTRVLRRTLELGTLGIVLGVIWGLMPYGPDALQLATMVFVASYASAVVLSGADSHTSNAWVVALCMGSLMIVASVHEVPYWPYIDLFLFTFLGSLLVLDKTLEGNVIALRRARDARTEFMAAASHDLGQPLQAARLFLEQAVGAPDADRREAATRNTRSALGAMERLIRQMLDHLSIESGGLTAVEQRFRTGEVIAAVGEQFTPVAALTGTELCIVPSNLEASGDPALVERALGNLVDNALRHAGASRVLIGARRHGGAVRLWVIDDGRGVAGDPQRLFLPFAQGTVVDGRPRVGLGIGLSSVRGLLAVMGGTTGIDPKWRSGAAFYLELPA